MSDNDQHRLEVLLEDINGKFNLVLEGHEALRKDIQDTHQQLNEKIDINTSLIRTVHDSLKTEIQNVGEKVGGHESRMQQLERRAA